VDGGEEGRGKRQTNLCLEIPSLDKNKIFVKQCCGQMPTHRRVWDHELMKVTNLMRESRNLWHHRLLKGLTGAYETKLSNKVLTV
jgi:hypothetical protein